MKILFTNTFKNGEQADLVHKIWIGLHQQDEIVGGRSALFTANSRFFMRCVDMGLCHPERRNRDRPKIHAIIPDSKGRWEVGAPIYMTVRTENIQEFQFVPTLLVRSIQQLRIRWCENHERMNVWVDGISLERQDVETLAFNEGFESVWGFAESFCEDCEAKIIHWTDFTYKVWDADALEKIGLIYPDATVKDGTLNLQTVTGEQFAAIAKIWPGDINCLSVSGMLRLDTRGRKITIGEAGEVTGSLENVILKHGKN
jgi:hypothetical protein